ncbi:class I SAM-dependent methyltransferase [Acidianus sp. HS-5]|uniref:class I SAM-dependent methyltransferase n=1 Tax=Acidianus sp. HS-5 TaxID=2886040 RepID=UPI001F460C7A|nr:class I SAM-dependent methyltransferase [Acidianus sp. HS-5]BDC18665.1 SAM-dependent methyltransferase [Acidianus sp. HS-5]
MDKFVTHLLSKDRKKFEDPEKFLPSLIHGVVAELGCGPGYYCQYLIKYAEKVYCVDKNKELLEVAKSLTRDAIFLNEDACKTSIPTSSVDIVLFANSFHDMRDKTKVYEEVKRILKPEGEVIIVDWKKDASLGPPKNIRMSKEDYLRVFSDFYLEKEFEVGPYHFGLVLKRRS